jgi:hypothetical protein
MNIRLRQWHYKNTMLAMLLWTVGVSSALSDVKQTSLEDLLITKVPPTSPPTNTPKVIKPPRNNKEKLTSHGGGYSSTIKPKTVQKYNNPSIHKATIVGLNEGLHIEAPILNAGDIITINIISDNPNKYKKTIQGDGTIYLDEIGKIKAAGKKITELAHEIEGRLTSINYSPLVSITPD